MRTAVVLSNVLFRERTMLAAHYLGDAFRGAKMAAALIRMRQGQTVLTNEYDRMIAEANRLLAWHNSGEVVRDAETVAALLPCGEGI